MSLAEYVQRHPQALLYSEDTLQNKQKSEAQKQAQSKKLIERFQTEAGALTKKQIAEAAKKMQQGPYGKIVAEHLRKLNRDPEMRARIDAKTRERYARGENPAKEWHASHREESLERAFYARQHQKKMSKPHAALKEAMVQAGLLSFVTEFEIGYYAIDEARGDIKLAVELDGCYFHGCQKCGLPGLPNNHRLDKSKDSYLTKRGWVVLCISECDVKKNLPQCIERIQQEVSRLGVCYGNSNGANA